MSDMIKGLRDRRLNVWEQMKGLADKATEENRAFSPEEQGAWDAMNDELDKLDTRIKSALDTAQRGKDADAAFDKLTGKKETRGSGGDGGNAAQTSSELRSFLRGEQGSPRFYDVKPEGPVDFRTLSKLSAAAGANVVPTSFYDRLIAHLIETAGMMQTGPTVLNTSGGEGIQVPKTTAHSTSAILLEAGTIATSEPAFGQITLGAYKYGTLMQVSRELLDDKGVDLEGYLAMQAGRALGNAFGAHMVTGTGSTMPRGVVTDATSGATGETTAQMGAGSVIGGVSYGPLVDLQYSVIAPYRSSSSAYWMMRDATVGALRKLRDTTGQPIWQPSVQLGVPDLLLGKPLVTDPNVAAIGSAAKSILFGDFSQYFVRMAGGVRFERSDDFAFSTDLVTFRALLRADGALVDLTGAVKFFTGGVA